MEKGKKAQQCKHTDFWETGDSKRQELQATLYTDTKYTVSCSSCSKKSLVVKNDCTISEGKSERERTVKERINQQERETISLRRQLSVPIVVVAKLTITIQVTFKGVSVFGEETNGQWVRERERKRERTTSWICAAAGRLQHWHSERTRRRTETKRHRSPAEKCDNGWPKDSKCSNESDKGSEQWQKKVKAFSSHFFSLSFNFSTSFPFSV